MISSGLNIRPEGTFISIEFLLTCSVLQKLTRLIKKEVPAGQTGGACFRLPRALADFSRSLAMT